jgi:SNF2 family DNA or RNA helicase
MSYVPKFAPYAHQREALTRIKDQRAFALLMAMRTGKTKVVLDDFGRLEEDGKCGSALIIAPAGAYRTWEKEITTHVGSSLADRLLTYTWSASAKSQKAMKAQAAFMKETLKPRIMMMNVEALSEVTRARDLAMAFLSQTRDPLCAIDESTAIRGPDSLRTKFILDKLRPLATWRRIMSGLPSPNSPFDLFAQFYFLDPEIIGHWTFKTFQNHFAEIQQICMIPARVLREKLHKMVGAKPFNIPGLGLVNAHSLSHSMLIEQIAKRGGYVPRVPVVKAYRNEEELRDLIAPYSYRVKLSDCYDLPPKVYSKREVELTAEQKRVYAEIKQYAFVELNELDHVTANHVLTRIIRLHQVLCGHVRDDSGTVRDLPENRTAQLLELLGEHDGKSITWCSYDHDIRKLTDALTKEYGESSVARFWGGNQSTREAEERRFREDPACRHMLATPGAGRFSRMWAIADLVVYYSNTPDLEHRSQSEDRAQGLDKINSVLYVDLIVPGTVDEKIINALRAKINMATTITGDNYQEWLI